MNPGRSPTDTGDLPRARANSAAESAAPVVVSTVRTTSTSSITGAGLKKCRPTTRSGRVVAAAIRVTDSAVVPVASTVSGGQSRSSSANSSRLSSSRSGISSITSPARAAAPRSWPKPIRPSSADRSSALIRPRSTEWAVDSSIRSRAASAAAASSSMPITSRPLRAVISAIPAPMVPRPTTATTGKS